MDKTNRILNHKMLMKHSNKYKKIMIKNLKKTKNKRKMNTKIINALENNKLALLILMKNLMNLSRKKIRRRD